MAAHNKRCEHRVFFTEEQNKRLHRMARYQGKAITDIIHTAALRSIGETEEERRRQKEDREESSSTTKQKSRGLLGRTSSPSRRREDDDPGEEREVFSEIQPMRLPEATPAPVSSSATQSLVEELAIYVRTGANWQRPQRMNEARRILSTKPSEERQKLTAALEERVAILDGKKVGMFSRLREGLFG